MVAVSTAGMGDTVAQTIATTGVGSVVLLDDSQADKATIAYRTNDIRALGTTQLPILVAVDQEGGRVQRLRGEGFAAMPTAVEQGKLDDAALQDDAREWGVQLNEAGIHFNLAPVGDIVPEGLVSSNEPIGRLQRYYSSDPQVASGKVTAFVRGMTQAGLATSVKHFPGLGRVVANTDNAPATDTTTSEGDPDWAPFRAAIAAGVSSVMVSSAVYQKLHPGVEAMFSKKIVTGMLRGDLDFDRVIISDDVGAAGSLKNVPMAERGTRFLRAGGDLVINANTAALPAMLADTLAKAKADPAFAKQIERSAARVLELKASVDLLDCGS